MSDQFPIKNYTVIPSSEHKESFKNILQYALDKRIQIDEFEIQAGSMEKINEDEDRVFVETSYDSKEKANAALVPNTKVKVISKTNKFDSCYFNYHRLHLAKQLEILLQGKTEEELKEIFTFTFTSYEDREEYFHRHRVFEKLSQLGLRGNFRAFSLEKFPIDEDTDESKFIFKVTDPEDLIYQGEYEQKCWLKIRPQDVYTDGFEYPHYWEIVFDSIVAVKSFAYPEYEKVVTPPPEGLLADTTLRYRNYREPLFNKASFKERSDRDTFTIVTDSPYGGGQSLNRVPGEKSVVDDETTNDNL